MTEVIEWLCSPPSEGGDANKCAHMAALAKKANTALTELEQHRTGGPERVTTTAGTADNFTDLISALSDTGRMGEYEDKFGKSEARPMILISVTLWRLRRAAPMNVASIRAVNSWPHR